MSATLLNLAVDKMRLPRRFGPHGLRRTMRTYLGKLGVDLIVAERALNHRLGGLVEIYDQGDYLPERRAALELWSRYLEHVEQGKPWKVGLLQQAA